MSKCQSLSKTTDYSPIQDYNHPDDHTQPTYQMTPGFKPFTVIHKTGDIQLTDYQQPCTNLEKIIVYTCCMWQNIIKTIFLRHLQILMSLVLLRYLSLTSCATNSQTFKNSYPKSSWDDTKTSTLLRFHYSHQYVCKCWI